MQTDYNEFFKYTKRNYKLDAEDYKATAPYIESAKAFARLTDESVYVVDYYKEGFLYVSPNPIFLCGKPAEEVLRDGYEFYLGNVPSDELDLLLEINKAGFEFYATVPVKDKLRCYITYDIHLKQPNSRLRMINHKLAPILSDKHSMLWLALCVVSYSSAKKPGNIYMSTEGSNEIHYYDLQKKQWLLQTVPELGTQEKEILSLAAQGLTNSQIAGKMYLSLSTIKFHKNNLFKKLGVRNISEAIVFSSNHKLL